MRNVSDKSLEKIKKMHCIFDNFFLDNRAFCEILWKNAVEPDRPQIALRRMRIARWITKATHTHSEYVQGADKSLARSRRKKATATEDFEFPISYLRI